MTVEKYSLKTAKDAELLWSILFHQNALKEINETTCLSTRYSETIYGAFANNQRWLEIHLHWHILPFRNFVDLVQKE